VDHLEPDLRALKVDVAKVGELKVIGLKIADLKAGGWKSSSPGYDIAPAVKTVRGNLASRKAPARFSEAAS
jgi:hypothetical protein